MWSSWSVTIQVRDERVSGMLHYSFLQLLAGSKYLVLLGMLGIGGAYSLSFDKLPDVGFGLLRENSVMSRLLKWKCSLCQLLWRAIDPSRDDWEGRWRSLGGLVVDLHPKTRMRVVASFEVSGSLLFLSQLRVILSALHPGGNGLFQPNIKRERRMCGRCVCSVRECAWESARESVESVER